MKTIALVAIFTICYVVCMDLVNKYMSSISFETVESSNNGDSSSIYSVSISGEVNNPGTYSVSKGSNLGYLISLAGGLTEFADITCFNSALTLENGASYYISYVSYDENNISTKISLNTATQAALDTLPGIGTVFSKRIIDYRISSGGFTSIEELKNVQGIGESLYESLKDLVCL